METTVRQRLILYLEQIKMGRNKFEKKAGLSLGYITKLKSMPGGDALEKIMSAAPDLNRVWLLTGEGEMFKTNVVPLVTEVVEKWYETKNGNVFYRKHNGKLVMESMVLPIAALGSPEDEFATILEEGDFEKVFWDVDEVHHGNYYTFRVKGNSMDDGSRGSFAEGDIVLVRELPKDDWMPKLRYKDWPFWVVVWGNNVRIKQILDQDGDTITLHSLNPSPEYTDFDLKLSEVSRLFNVVKHRHDNSF